MSKRNMFWDKTKLDRFLKEKRGMGEGEAYKPWLTIQDMPSQGRVSRVYGYKTNRIHHFFSDMETRAYYLFSWEDTIDIREHYPLLDLEDSIKDLGGLDLTNFVDKETGTPYVLTTTFLLTLKDEDGKEYYVARSVKSAEKLEQKYIVERFEIERRYWESKRVDWGIITQKDINVTKAKNIEWVYPSLLDCEIESEAKLELAMTLLSDLHNSNHAVRKVTSYFDNTNNLKPGTGLSLFKYLVASKTIIIDMEKDIDINASLKQLLI